MGLIKKTAGAIRVNLVDILIFELLYRIFVFPVFLFALEQGLRLAMEAAGFSYITEENLAGFLIRPATLLLLLFLILAGLAVTAVEAGALLTAFEGAAYSRRVMPPGMLAGGIRKSADELKKRNKGLFLLIGAGGLFIQVIPLYLLLSRIKPVNFVVEELLSLRGGRWGAGLFLVFLAVWLAARAYMPQYSMIEQKAYGDSRWKSFCLFRKRWRRTLLLFLAGNLGLAAVMAFAYFLGEFFTAAAVMLLVRQPLQLAAQSRASGVVELALIFAYSIFTAVLNLGMLTAVYYQNEESAKERQPYFVGKGWRDGGRAAALCGVVAAAGAAFLFNLAFNGSRLRDDAFLEIQITAHRGSSKSAPENTMAAIEMAVEEMADFAEVDVQESRDGELVLCHDRNLKRVAGTDRRVEDLTLEELLKLDVGSSFSAAYAGEKIPLLSEVMEYAKGKINLNLELKNIGKETDMPEKAAALIREMEMEEQCVITSTSMEYLKRVKEAAPDIRTGYIIAAAYGNYFENEYLDFISIRSSFVTAAMAERAHEAGKAVHAWTVNTKSEMEEMKMAGVDNIITDYPVEAREICYREEAAEGLLERLRLLLQ